MVTFITTKVEDPKQAKLFVKEIIEDILTKRPFSKHSTLLLLDTNQFPTIQQGEIAKLARECFKNLTSEDFMHLAQSD